jgi:hypothetical protein
LPHGKICYLEIPANVTEASAEFYSSIFGWTVRTRGDGELAFDDTGGVSGTWVKESDRTPDEQTRIYIMVDVIADTLKRIEAEGGRVLTPRTEIGQAALLPFVRADEHILLFVDNDGVLLPGDSYFSYTLNRLRRPHIPQR